MKLIETHFHLDYLKAFERSEIIEKAKAENVEKFITIAVEPKNLSVVRQISNEFNEVYFTQGIHPHEAKFSTPDSIQEIKNHLDNPKCVAVGEIGLDYHYDNSPRDIQRKVFEQHLEIACENDLPVVIHTRDADDDTTSILRNFSTKLKRKGVIHSFTASIEFAEFALGEGFYLGFNGIITFKKADDVRQAVKIAPIEKILFETDSPFLTPVPHRGKENGPYFLPHIAEKVLEIKELGKDAIDQVYKNSFTCFPKLAN